MHYSTKGMKQWRVMFSYTNQPDRHGTTVLEAPNEQAARETLSKLVPDAVITMIKRVDSGE